MSAWDFASEHPFFAFLMVSSLFGHMNAIVSRACDWVEAMIRPESTEAPEAAAPEDEPDRCEELALIQQMTGLTRCGEDDGHTGPHGSDDSGWWLNEEDKS